MVTRRSAAACTTSGSVIRDILAVSQRPEVVSLAGGVPDAGLLEPEQLARWLLAAASDPKSFGYGVSEGEAGLRNALASRLPTRILPDAAERIVVTTGSQQALDLIIRLLVEPGDCIVVERPCYPAVLQLAAAAGASVVDVECDEEGLLPAALAEALDRHRPAVVYTGPSFQNPTGAVQSSSRRSALVCVLEQFGTPVIEDDAYGELWFDEPPPGPLAMTLPDQVAYVCTLSKVLAPGIRIGWVVVPEALRPALIRYKQGADLNTSSLLQAFAETMLRDRGLDRHLSATRPRYRERAATLVRGLRQVLPSGTVITEPVGGFYVWARLPEHWSADDLLRRSLALGVAFVPGSGFYATDGERNTMRLAFSAETPDRLDQGLERLERAVAALER